jgi:AhpD family alkylhydroperoxidase
MVNKRQNLKSGSVSMRSRIVEKPMDEKMKELIAIGVSIGSHCQPCLTYHVARAREIGISVDMIRAAMEIGHMVEKGSMVAMQNFAKGVFDTPKQGELACCPDNAEAGGKSCCS